MYLVTGANGFVGRQLCSALLASGNQIRKIVRHKGPDDKTEQYVCDLATDSISKKTFEYVDTVFHLAGFTHDLRDASKIEHLYRAVNVDATAQLVELSANCGVKRFVFVSSVKAGGSAVAGRCMTEEDQGCPDGVYGTTKREAELKVLATGRESGMHVSILRPSLVYGPGVKGNLRMMLSGIEKGWFPPLPKIENRRSMIHVDDLVRALLLVAGNERANSEIFIATDGVQYSARDIYDTMCIVAGKKIPKWSVPICFFDILAKFGAGTKRKIDKLLGDECFSTEKLKSIGFTPKYTLKDMDEAFF